MIEIKPIGQFFKADTAGNILNPCSIDLIPNHWLPVIELVKQSYIQNLPENFLHSIYLRGSIPRGQNVEGISDLDSFALINESNIRWKKATWSNEIIVLLQERFNFVNDVEIMLSSFNKTLFKTNPRLSVILKTQSLCLYGSDIIPSLPQFRPGKSMMLNYSWLEEDINNFIQKSIIQKTDCQEITKTIIRTGFELVMESEKKYTPDLYLCYYTFSEYYPQQEKAMKKMLHFYLNPPQNVSFLREFVGNFGFWMVKEVRKQIG